MPNAGRPALRLERMIRAARDRSPPEPLDSPPVNWKLFWIGLAIGAVFLVATAHTTDVREQARLLREIPLSKLGWFAAGCGFHLAHLAGRTLRWRLLFPAPRPAPRRLFSALSIGYLYNNMVPRSGELVRMLVVGKWVPALGFGGIAVTIAVERLLDVLMVLALAVLIFAGSHFAAHDVTDSPRSIVWLVAIAVGIAALAAAAVLFQPRVERIADLVIARSPARIRVPLRKLANGVLAGLAGLRALGGRTGLGVLALCALDFVLVNTSYRLLSGTFAPHLLSITDTAFVMVGSGLGAMLPSGPGNVGSMIYFMSVAAGHTPMAPAAAAYAFLIFLSYFLVRSTSGLVCLALETRRERSAAPRR